MMSIIKTVKSLSQPRRILIFFTLFSLMILASTPYVNAANFTNVDVKTSMITDDGLNFPSTARFGMYPNSGGQKKITTFNDYQYATFYNSQPRVCVARRKLNLPSGTPSPWQVVVLNYTPEFGGVSDTHCSTQLGICRGDGTIHLAFDHHVSDLHYIVSSPAAAANPDGVTWSADLFPNPVTSILLSQAETSVTYPVFIDVPNGDLQLMMRQDGGSGAANSYLYTYSASSHRWSAKQQIISKTGNYQYDGTTGTSRSAYFDNPISYGQDGKLSICWIWRETTDANSSHDICFASSSDYGAHWEGNANPIPAVSLPFGIQTSGITAEAIPPGQGLYNIGSGYVDSNGDYHTIISYAANVYSNWSKARQNAAFYHYWRHDGTWNVRKTGLPTVGKISLVFTKNNKAYVIYTQNGKITISTPADNDWTDWESYIYDSGSIKYDRPVIDYGRWRDEGVLSVFIQRTTNAAGAPSMIESIDFRIDDAPLTTTGPTGGPTFMIVGAERAI